MKKARLIKPDGSREAVGFNFLDPADEYVLRDEHGDVRIVWHREMPEGERLEVQCERCGRFGELVGRSPTGRWTCDASDTDGACAASAQRGWTTE